MIIFTIFCLANWFDIIRCHACLQCSLDGLQSSSVICFLYWKSFSFLLSDPLLPDCHRGQRSVAGPNNHSAFCAGSIKAPLSESQINVIGYRYLLCTCLQFLLKCFCVCTLIHSGRGLKWWKFWSRVWKAAMRHHGSVYISDVNAVIQYMYWINSGWKQDLVNITAESINAHVAEDTKLWISIIQ